MSVRPPFVLKALMWLALFVVGVIVIRYVGELVFYFPGVIAKRLSYELTGSGRGVVTSIIFYLVAAGFVLVLAALGWGVTLVDRWLDARRSKP